MVTWMLRVAAVIFGVFSAVMIINALWSGAWQFWAGAAGFAVATLATWQLAGRHRSVGEGDGVVLDPTTAMIAGVAVLGVVAAGVCMSTL